MEALPNGYGVLKDWDSEYTEYTVIEPRNHYHTLDTLADALAKLYIRLNKREQK